MLGGLDAGELSHHGLLGLGDWLLFYRIPFSLSERDRPLTHPPDFYPETDGGRGDRPL
jgi:hypothetical protein